MQSLSAQILERGAEFLKSAEILSRMDDQTKADIQAGKKEFYLADFYIRKKIAGFAGTVDLVKETDDKSVGVTNLDKGYLPKGTYLAIVAVGLAYGYKAAVDNVPSEVRYATSEYLNTIPTKIINCEFNLLNGDKPLLKARTKKFFANAYADFAAEANDENCVLLPTPKLVDHSKRIKAQLEFAEDGLAAPANSHYLEVRMVGVYVGDRI